VNGFRVAQHCVNAYPEMPKDHIKMVSLAVTSAYTVPVLIGGSIRIMKLNSVISGVNATTFHNMSSSADCVGIITVYMDTHDVYFDEEMAKEMGGISFQEALKEIVKIIYDSLGFKFKDLQFTDSFENIDKVKIEK